MQTGMSIKDDADFDYVIALKQEVEVKLFEEVDYRGKLIGYTKEAFQAASGGWYRRGLADVKTV